MLEASIDPQRLCAYLERCLHISSPSHKEGAIAAWLCETFRMLGVAYYVDDSAKHTGSDTGNVIVGGRGRAWISFCAHMDTISIYRPVPYVIENDVVRGENGGLIGLDDKCGIAVLLETISVMQQSGGIPQDIHFIFTTSEEDLFLGARYVDERHFVEALNFVVDSGGVPIGYTVNRGVVQYDFLVSVQGRMSHTGSAEGKSALLLAAELLGMLPTGRASNSAFVNVADIRCEGNPNTILGHTMFLGQILSEDEAEVERIIREMEETVRWFSNKHNCAVNLQSDCSCMPLYTDEDSEIVRYARSAADRVGLKFRLGRTGAGSDAHVFAQRGGAALKISTGMMNVHSTDEYVNIKDMADCVAYVLALAGFCKGEKLTVSDSKMIVYSERY